MIHRIKVISEKEHPTSIGHMAQYESVIWHEAEQNGIFIPENRLTP